jgi:NAD(P)-dependent dehydrogenase (short-subunit alcohol dehydrogenase family)
MSGFKKFPEVNMSNLFDIHGKVAVITGAAGILGSEMTRALAKEGVKVAILDIDQKKAETLSEQIKADGGISLAVQTDVLDKNSIIQAKDIIIRKFNKVDILINGAGGNKKEATTSDEFGSFLNLPPEAIQWVFNLNFLGSVLPTQVFGEVMAKSDEGIIINISSMAAYRPLTKTIAYSAAKAAISNFTQWMAVHFNQNYSKNIRVNAIAPGFFLTEQNRFLLTDQETGAMTARGEQIIKHTPMGRYGTPDELVGTLIWLLSDGAKFVNGVVIPVDGGFSAYSGV